MHGPVRLTDTEWRLVGTQAFQRLRHIKQLGLLDLVFPGAQHTRFTHSLGTLAVMARLIEGLSAGAGATRKHLQQWGPTLRVAALLHDIGHFPLSHLLERMYQARLFGANHRQDDLVEADLSAAERPTVDDGSGSVAVSRRYLDEAVRLYCADAGDLRDGHETLSGHVIRKRPEIKTILEEAGFNPAAAASLITGHTDTGAPLFVSQLMNSAIDADNLDYLVRDATETGTVYGRVDASSILGLLCVGEARDEKAGRSPHLVLAFPEKAIGAADHYVLARYHWYSQIVYHETVVGFSILGGALALYMMDHGLLPFRKFDEIKDSVSTEEFIGFTDQCFWQGVRRLAAEGDPVGAWARSLLFRLRPTTADSQVFFSPSEGYRCGVSSDPGGDFATEVSVSILKLGPHGRPSDSSFGGDESTQASETLNRLRKALRVVSKDTHDAVCLGDCPSSLAAQLSNTAWRSRAAYSVHTDALLVRETEKEVALAPRADDKPGPPVPIDPS
jgi:hypothetical protein